MIGGDEFAIIVPGLKHLEALHRIGQRLIECIAPPFLIDEHRLSVGLSVGVAIASDSSLSDTDHLLRCADMALYEAKRNGRNRVEYYSAELDEAARKRRAIEIDLRLAIAEQQLQVYYQPIIDQLGQTITGYEALMRWQHPEKGLIMPLEFISVAEETGLIHELGALALHSACHEAATWPDQQTVAVNLSPLQFKNSAFVGTVEAALQQSGLAPNRLELEITESVLLDDTEGNIQILRALKALGVRIALDDFGTGYSSLSYLRSFHFDRIKIDRSFVKDMHDSREALAVIRAIAGISASLDIQITAEGVESSEQFQQLQEEGCSHFQGYFFGRPVPAGERLACLPGSRI
jgi:predicted signal transduction protein with EAL and GGDEF domain